MTIVFTTVIDPVQQLRKAEQILKPDVPPTNAFPSPHIPSYIFAFQGGLPSLVSARYATDWALTVGAMLDRDWVHKWCETVVKVIEHNQAILDAFYAHLQADQAFEDEFNANLVVPTTLALLKKSPLFVQSP